METIKIMMLKKQAAVITGWSGRSVKTSNKVYVM